MQFSVDLARGARERLFLLLRERKAVLVDVDVVGGVVVGVARPDLELESRRHVVAQLAEDGGVLPDIRAVEQVAAGGNADVEPAVRSEVALVVLVVGTEDPLQLVCLRGDDVDLLRVDVLVRDIAEDVVASPCLVPSRSVRYSVWPFWYPDTERRMVPFANL